MILCYEENDRIAIETTGMRIVEFKRMIYKLSGIFEKVFETIRKVVDMIADTVREGFRSITSTEPTEPRKRWKIVKPLIKAGLPCGMFFPNWRAYHCRNNC